MKLQSGHLHGQTDVEFLPQLRSKDGGDNMKPSTYYQGNGHSKYGIYNKAKKEFQFGICEDTPMLAEARLFQKIGEDAKKWRFEVREVPE